MKATLKRILDNEEFYTSERCFITELSNSADDFELSIARARVEPGVVTRWHRLVGTAERYCVLSGRGRMEIQGMQPQQVGSGDVVLIPAGCWQRIANTGSGNLVFLAICTPRFCVDDYQETDQPEGPK